MITVVYRRPNQYDVRAASDEAAIPPGGHGESLTVQAHAEDADINVMMRRFGVTGRLPENVRVPQYADFSEVSDFRSALHSVMEAQDNFMQLDAAVRQRFSNDPQLFLDFCSDPANLPELRKMGLAKEIGDGGGVSSGTGSVIGGSSGAAARGGSTDGASVGGSSAARSGGAAAPPG